MREIPLLSGSLSHTVTGGNALRNRLTVRESRLVPRDERSCRVPSLRPLVIMTDEQENVERAGWMPRFTIRTLLAICTLCAVASVIIGTAYRGQYWAWGVTIGLASLVITALVHAAWFGALWLLAQLPERHPTMFPSLASPQASVGGSSTIVAEDSKQGTNVSADG